jgi:hypothetical protein
MKLADWSKNEPIEEKLKKTGFIIEIINSPKRKMTVAWTKSKNHQGCTKTIGYSIIDNKITTEIVGAGICNFCLDKK